MKNKEALLKLSDLSERMAKSCWYVGIAVSVVALLDSLEASSENPGKGILPAILSIAIMLVIAKVFNIILSSISELMKAIIDIKEDTEKIANKSNPSSSYVTN